MKMSSILINSFCERHNIDTNKHLEIEEINARELIVPQRIDLIVKLKYIEFREKGYDLEFMKDIYAAHIKAMNKAAVSEYQRLYPNPLDDTFETLNSLIDSMKANGLDRASSVIFVGSNNVILDEGHSTAVAAYFNLKLPIIRIDTSGVEYNVDFFRKNLLEEEYIDYIMTEFCKIKKNLYFVCIWPKANEETRLKEMQELMSRTCSIIYNKAVELNYLGLCNFMKEIYRSEKWIGTLENHYSGVKHKAKFCYLPEGQIKCYIVEADSNEFILELKNQIRDIFNIGKHSVHITDNSEETLQTANLLLNSNGIDFLNTAYPDKYINFNRQLNDFKKRLVENNLLAENFIINSDSFLAFYGLKSINNLYFLTTIKDCKFVENEFIYNHNDSSQLYGTSLEDLILNPNNYVIYNGLKFVSLKALMEIIKNRNEKQDKIDLQLIKSIQENKRLHSFYLLLKRRWTKANSFYIR